LVDLKAEKPSLRRAVVKLNDSFSGVGNALFRYRGTKPTADHLSGLQFSVEWESREDYFEKFARMGGIVEEFLEGDEKASPSVQLRVNPHGSVIPISTHDQVL